MCGSMARTCPRLRIGCGRMHDLSPVLLFVVWWCTVVTVRVDTIFFLDRNLLSG